MTEKNKEKLSTDKIKENNRSYYFKPQKLLQLKDELDKESACMKPSNNKDVSLNKGL